MRFLTYFLDNREPEFISFYCDLKALLELLRSNSETEFVQRLDSELSKVIAFVNTRARDLKELANDLEKRAKAVYTKKKVYEKDGRDPQGFDTPTESSFSLSGASRDSKENCNPKTIHESNIDYVKSTNTKKLSYLSLKSTLKKDLKTLKKQISKLSHFMRLNAVAFNKILKRHDSKNDYKLRPMYKVKLKKQLRELEDLDSLIYKVSKIVLVMSNEDLKVSLSTHAFVRKTTKYWVHKENLPAVKCMILNHLPVYVHTGNENRKGSKKDSKFSNLNETMNKSMNKTMNTSINNSNSYHLSSSNSNPTKSSNLQSPYANWNPKSHDTCISSVYLDNAQFELYHGRLMKTQGAEAIRIRWYGRNLKDEVFVERKKHEEDWTGDKSAKLRFKMPENKINEYLNGRNVWSFVEPLNKENVEDAFVLYNQVQNSIMNRKLQPSVRTFYKRTAFQLPNSAQVRISLDTHLCMIKEQNTFGEKKPVQISKERQEAQDRLRKLHREDVRECHGHEINPNENHIFDNFYEYFYKKTEDSFEGGASTIMNCDILARRMKARGNYLERNESKDRKMEERRLQKKGMQVNKEETNNEKSGSHNTQTPSKDEEEFSLNVYNWKRTDVDCEYPFIHLKDDEIVRFPYAILEIKLQSFDGEKPSWIQDLLNSDLIEHVDKFSKFMHASSILYPQIKTIPYWLPQMHKDISKFIQTKKIINNRSESTKISAKSKSNRYNFHQNNASTQKPEKIEGPPQNAQSSVKNTSNNQYPEIRKKDLNCNINYVNYKNTYVNSNKNSNEFVIPIESEQTTDYFSESNQIVNIDNKKIAIPVRVEPKVFFANERTFLSWLHFSIFIGGIGTAMMGLGDTKAMYSGMVFIFVSILFAIYALYLYFWRAGKIRVKDPGPYDDLYGPAVLVAVFLTAMALSVFFKMQIR